MRQVLIVAVVTAAAVLTGCGTVPSTHRGVAVAALRVGVAEYDLGDTAFQDPPWSGRAEIAAQVHYPADLPGPAPLIIQLHGQAAHCAIDALEAGWPCPPGVRPVPSYRGYDYLGEALARRGFVVVPISANGLNARLGTAAERAHLLNTHLALWRRLAADGTGPLADAFVETRTGHQVTPRFRGRCPA
ncbi:hypothetical protein AMIS_26450 [Actinoplanes missouriensis 431]|uniref:Uncharacterized protein n=1 Tax=Actinoplanes missouriensis (strain ATCC 14538 / DSM 43046 / CBS 188.64 / JCM 3121 / NBRC 102363 / NCIMB 12654 / NRRL B-3342 / UNCC 431) TaxID=512565 RepID=I0H4C8_ACTM4|nr:hypothetical protein [Actinoplanes missouriensis]BAL87865.1 hypothetical protein AMIS_26450 [Actinoplanes missouriensis 431]